MAWEWWCLAGACMLPLFGALAVCGVLPPWDALWLAAASSALCGIVAVVVRRGDDQ